MNPNTNIRNAALGVFASLCMASPATFAMQAAGSQVSQDAAEIARRPVQPPCPPGESTEQCLRERNGTHLPPAAPGPLPQIPPPVTPLPPLAVNPDQPSVILPPPTGDKEAVKKPPPTGDKMPVIAPPTNPEPKP